MTANPAHSLDAAAMSLGLNIRGHCRGASDMRRSAMKPIKTYIAVKILLD
jgi:hypothetical protein